MRKHALLLAQVALSCVLLWRLFGRDDLRGEALLVLESANLGWLAAGVCTAVFSELICVVRWWLILRVFGVPVGIFRATAFSAAGLFFSVGLPGSGGGDAFRILYVIRVHPGRKLAAVLSVIADRLCGLIALLVSLTLPLSQQSIFMADQKCFSILWVAVAVLVSAMVLIVLWWLTTIPGIHEKWLHLSPRKFRSEIVKMGEIFSWLANSPRTIIAAVALSMASLLMHFTTYWFSTVAFGLGLPFIQMMAVMPLVDALTMLPITFFGIGLRETLFEYLLGGLWGVPQSSATLASLGGFIVQIGVALLGVGALPFTFPQKSVRGEVPNLS